MLSRTESLFLEEELNLNGNVNYERVLTCKIKKKVEKSIVEEFIIALLPVLDEIEKKLIRSK